MKSFSLLLLLIAASLRLFSQGCSDAGVCTAGNFNSLYNVPIHNSLHKNEIDFTFNYATHGKDERFYQPQINYRLIKKNKSFFEFRLPVNIVNNTSAAVSTTGIGDIMTSYNNSFPAGKKNRIDYTLGVRVSLTEAARKAVNANESYPMNLQSGLGTTDLVAVTNYDIIKYFNVGMGFQLPLLQYNKNKKMIIPPGSTEVIAAEGYRRQVDALLKLTAHYQTGKFKMNAAALGIFHLADDYYKTSKEKYILKKSKGTTINAVLDANYAVGTKVIIGLLYAQPLRTRKNVPDGLGRSAIITPKLTLAF